MNDVVTLKSMTMLALEHDVDFEVFHGETTHKDKRVRAQMVLSLKDCPEVRVSFGDKKHDQRVSTVSLARNYKIPVKLADLITAMKQNSAGNHWFRLMNRETPLFNIESMGAGLIVITGTVQKGAEQSDHLENGEFCKFYQLSVPNKLLNSSTSTVVETAPTTFYAEMPLDAEGKNSVTANVGNEVTLVGEYVFPDRIKVVAIKD